MRKYTIKEYVCANLDLSGGEHMEYGITDGMMDFGCYLTRADAEAAIPELRASICKAQAEARRQRPARIQ